MSVKRLYLSGLILGLVLLTAACSTDTSAQTATPKPTAAPNATVGSLINVDVPDFGLSIQVPSTWHLPVMLPDKSGFILSPDGSTDTTKTAGPFLFMLPDAGKVASSRLTYTFRPDIDDPMQQLDLLWQAINIDAPAYDDTQAYIGAQYPAAMKVGYERGLELVYVLLNPSKGHWVFIGIQSLESEYPYFNSAVFTPLINSLKFTTP